MVVRMTGRGGGGVGRSLCSGSERALSSWLGLAVGKERGQPACLAGVGLPDSQRVVARSSSASSIAGFVPLLHSRIYSTAATEGGERRRVRAWGWDIVMVSRCGGRS